MLILTPDLDIHNKTTFIEMLIQRRSKYSRDAKLSDAYVALKKPKFIFKPNQLTDKCMWSFGCYRVVIYSFYNADIGIGKGSFEARWNG